MEVFEMNLAKFRLTTPFDCSKILEFNVPNFNLTSIWALRKYSPSFDGV